jgi:hypothetical protein
MVASGRQTLFLNWNTFMWAYSVRLLVNLWVPQTSLMLVRATATVSLTVHLVPENLIPFWRVCDSCRLSCQLRMRLHFILGGGHCVKRAISLPSWYIEKWLKDLRTVGATVEAHPIVSGVAVRSMSSKIESRRSHRNGWCISLECMKMFSFRLLDRDHTLSILLQSYRYFRGRVSMDAMFLWTSDD